jgi:hypothetical protein
MSRVKVTFYVEADDPDHWMGITEESHIMIEDAIMQVGGEDSEYEKVEE